MKFIWSPSKLLFALSFWFAMFQMDEIEKNQVSAEEEEKTVSDDVKATEEVQQEIDGDWDGLIRSCPLKLTRLTPCIDYDNNLSKCTSCITDFVRAADAVSGAVETGNSTSICNGIQSEICSGIGSCGTSCGLVTDEGSNGKIASFFQFGSNCERLFLDLVMCAMEAEDLLTSECALDSCNSNNTASPAKSSRVSSFVSGLSIAILSSIFCLF